MIGPESIREQQHNKPLEIKDQEMFDKTLEYIHLNAVMAGFVTKSEDWKYSSAIDFTGSDSNRKKGLIELNFSSGLQWHKRTLGPTRFPDQRHHDA